MALKSIALACAKNRPWFFLLLALTLTSSVFAETNDQGFGRFGFELPAKLSDWVINSDGIKPEFAGSNRLLFDRQVSTWHILARTQSDCTYGIISPGRAPTKIRLNLFASGPEMYFGRGFRLRVRSDKPPILSWTEGSVGPEVPTPAKNWVSISYQNSQPPIMIGFLNKNASLMVTGSSGDWLIESPDEKYQGWVRFSLPLGQNALTTTTAQTLGLLAASASKHSNFWFKGSPRLEDKSARFVRGGVEMTWTFNRGYIKVPQVASLAITGGYPIEFRTKIINAGAQMLNGPTRYSPGNTMTIFFPLQRIPSGKAVVSLKEKILSDLSKRTTGQVVTGGFHSMMSVTGPDFLLKLQAIETKFYETAIYTSVPISKQQLPFTLDAKGMTAAASVAFMRQSLIHSGQETSSNNPLLISLQWCLDSDTWRIVNLNGDSSRRVSAIMSLAFLHSDNPLKVATAGMLHAGLSAERGLQKERKVTLSKLLEPMDRVRADLFSKQRIRKSLLAEALLSPVRILDGPIVTATNINSKSVRIGWNVLTPVNEKITLSFPFAIKLSKESASSYTMTPLNNENSLSEGFVYQIIKNTNENGFRKIDVYKIVNEPFNIPWLPNFTYSESSR